MKEAIVVGSFDDLRLKDVRFLEKASRVSDLHALVLTDDAVRAACGQPPKFPQDERLYLVGSIRYVNRVTLVAGSAEPNALPELDGLQPAAWVVTEQDDHPDKRAFCAANGINYRVVANADLSVVPRVPKAHIPAMSSRKKVLVTGSFDWFHSGHARFFEEASQLGDVFAVVGHDANIRLLKGEGHPLFPQAERCYMVQAIRYVKQAMISSGNGWLDAEPEIEKIRPDIYAVNEDGDKPEKREFCARAGIEYIVMKRLPKPSLPQRQSTNLRGF